MAATLLVAIGVSAVWSFEPAWVNEAGVYSLLGTTAAWLFVVFMLFGFLAERVKEFFSLRASWRRWRSRYRDVAWPTLRAVLSRIIEVALGLLIVWLMIDQVLTLPTVLKPEGIFIGMLLVLRGFLALLDGIWRRLDRAGASTRTKVTLLTLPIGIGTLAGTCFAFVPRTEPLQVAMIVSGVAFVGCIAAGIIMLALRMSRTVNGSS